MQIGCIYLVCLLKFNSMYIYISRKIIFHDTYYFYYVTLGLKLDEAKFSL